MKKVLLSVGAAIFTLALLANSSARNAAIESLEGIQKEVMSQVVRSQAELNRLSGFNTDIDHMIVDIKVYPIDDSLITQLRHKINKMETQYPNLSKRFADKLLTIIDQLAFSI